MGVHINNKLDWIKNSEAIYKKGQSLFFEEAETFNICKAASVVGVELDSLTVV